MKTSNIVSFVVLYVVSHGGHVDTPSAFVVKAEDADVAEELCQEKFLGAEIVWVCQTDNIDGAYDEYWGVSPESGHDEPVEESNPRQISEMSLWDSHDYFKLEAETDYESHHHFYSM